jgi:hypothetical protein
LCKGYHSWQCIHWWWNHGFIFAAFHSTKSADYLYVVQHYLSQWQEVKETSIISYWWGSRTWPLHK